VVGDHDANPFSVTYRAVTGPKLELALMGVVATSVARKVIWYVSFSRRPILHKDRHLKALLIHLYLTQSLHGCYLLREVEAAKYCRHGVRRAKHPRPLRQYQEKGYSCFTREHGKHGQIR
jgi:hypothetical protein